MEERLNQTLLRQLVQEVKDLKDKVDRLNGIGDIYHNNKPDTLNTEVKTYPKDLNYLKQLLQNTSSPSTNKFLLSIINNNYPTITHKQKSILEDIEKQQN